MDAVDDFINSNSGGGAPSFALRNIGDSIAGTITRKSLVSTKDDDGNAVNNVVLELETLQEYTQDKRDKNGITKPVTGTNWSLWIKPSQLMTAVSTALKEAGVRGITVGDRIAVEFYATEPNKNPMHSPKKLHKVLYKPAAPAAHSATSVEDLLG